MINFVTHIYSVTTKSIGDKNYLIRKCVTPDKQRAELVYKLYGLMEEEIKIVDLKF